MYSNDPVYHDYKPVQPVRLWPYVLAGIVVGLLLWAYFTPIPHLSKIEPMVMQVP